MRYDIISSHAQAYAYTTRMLREAAALGAMLRTVYGCCCVLIFFCLTHHHPTTPPHPSPPPPCAGGALPRWPRRVAAALQRGAAADPAVSCTLCTHTVAMLTLPLPPLLRGVGREGRDFGQRPLVVGGSVLVGSELQRGWTGHRRDGGPVLDTRLWPASLLASSRSIVAPGAVRLRDRSGR